MHQRATSCKQDFLVMAGAVWPIWDLQMWKKLAEKKKRLCSKQLEVKRDGSIQATGTQRHFFFER